MSRPRGRPSNGFDKKAYDRDRMKRVRLEAKMAKGAEGFAAILNSSEPLPSQANLPNPPKQNP